MYTPSLMNHLVYLSINSHLAVRSLAEIDFEKKLLARSRDLSFEQNRTLDQIKLSEQSLIQYVKQFREHFNRAQECLQKAEALISQVCTTEAELKADESDRSSAINLSGGSGLRFGRQSMFCTIAEAAAYLSKTSDEVMQMVHSGKFQEFRDRDQLMLRWDQVESVYLASPQKDNK